MMRSGFVVCADCGLHGPYNNSDLGGSNLMAGPASNASVCADECEHYAGGLCFGVVFFGVRSPRP